MRLLSLSELEIEWKWIFSRESKYEIKDSERMTEYPRSTILAPTAIAILILENYQKKTTIAWR